MSDEEITPPSHPSAAREGTRDNLKVQFSVPPKGVRKFLAAVLSVAVSGGVGWTGHHFGASESEARIAALEQKLDEHVKDQATADQHRDEKLENLEIEIAKHLGGIDQGISNLNGAINTISTRLDNHLAHPELAARPSHRVTQASDTSDE